MCPTQFCRRKSPENGPKSLIFDDFGPFSTRSNAFGPKGAFSPENASFWACRSPSSVQNAQTWAILPKLADAIATRRIPRDGAEIGQAVGVHWAQKSHILVFLGLLGAICRFCGRNSRLSTRGQRDFRVRRAGPVGKFWVGSTPVGVLGRKVADRGGFPSSICRFRPLRPPPGTPAIEAGNRPKNRRKIANFAIFADFSDFRFRPSFSKN